MIDRHVTAKKIHISRITKDQKCKEWAKALGITPQFLSQVIHGIRKTQYVRDYIEEQLGQTFWS